MDDDPQAFSIRRHTPDGFSPKRYRRVYDNLLLAAQAYCLDISGRYICCLRFSYRLAGLFSKECCLSVTQSNAVLVGHDGSERGGSEAGDDAAA